jgi:hypothetical protein
MFINPLSGREAKSWRLYVHSVAKQRRRKLGRREFVNDSVAILCYLGLWVTIMMVRPSSCSFFMIFMTPSPTGKDFLALEKHTTLLV